MSERQPPRPGQLPLQPLREQALREPEWVGPDTRREDMTGVSERKLALRSVHEALLTREEMRAWTHNQNRLDARVGTAEVQLADHEQRIVALEKPVTTPLPPMRDPESSYHPFDSDLRDLREDIRAKVKDRHNPLSEADAVRLIRGEVARMKAATELGTWRRIKLFFTTQAGKTLDRVTTILIAAVIGWLVHHFLSSPTPPPLPPSPPGVSSAH